MKIEYKTPREERTVPLENLAIGAPFADAEGDAMMRISAEVSATMSFNIDDGRLPCVDIKTGQAYGYQPDMLVTPVDGVMTIYGKEPE